MSSLRELHLLFTYQCTFECDHCFVWGSPSQTGTMTLAQVRRLLEQGEALGTVRAVCFCQRIVLGNAWQWPLVDIMREYQPTDHPICGPLLEGGPAGLARAFRVKHEATYVDECHCCYDLRRRLRRRLGQWLAPDQMYSVSVNG